MYLHLHLKLLVICKKKNTHWQCYRAPNAFKNHFNSSKQQVLQGTLNYKSDSCYLKKKRFLTGPVSARNTVVNEHSILSWCSLVNWILAFGLCSFLRKSQQTVYCQVQSFLWQALFLCVTEFLSGSKFHWLTAYRSWCKSLLALLCAEFALMNPNTCLQKVIWRSSIAL